MVNMESCEDEKDKNVLEFMDSTDSYLLLISSLSSSLRQGWMELASARHSMGASRISSALFDLKSHSAATTLQLNHHDAELESEKLHFSLFKWASSESPKCCSKEEKFEDKLLQKKSNSPKVLNQDGSSNPEAQEEVSEAPEATESPRMVEDQARKERLKSLSVFGVLVCPKLRAAQSSFETADLLNAYDEVREKLEHTE
ncbi:unnamed protein product [Withania somnifera]